MTILTHYDPKGLADLDRCCGAVCGAHASLGNPLGLTAAAELVTCPACAAQMRQITFLQPVPEPCQWPPCIGAADYIRRDPYDADETILVCKRHANDFEEIPTDE